MTEQSREGEARPDPQLKPWTIEPKGVLQKHAKAFVFLGASLLVIVAAIFSAGGGVRSAKNKSKSDPPQPLVVDETDNNVADLKSQLATGQLKAQQESSSAAARTTTPDANLLEPRHGNCLSGEHCLPPPGGPAQTPAGTQVSPAQQEMEQIAAKEHERDYNARFSSNLVYTRSLDESHTEAGPSLPGLRTLATADSVAAPRATSAEPARADTKRPPEVNLDSASGAPYVVYEGTTLDTILMNRLDGDAVGPVKALVSVPLYSHDHQHVLIPEGTVVLGEAKKIGASGFGQQRRMAVVFHRMLMPDGYSVDLDQFHGLDQIGEAGLKDKVDNHYFQIFGTSIALGIVAGAAEIEQGGGTVTTSGSQSLTNGASASLSQSATTILDRFLQIPPTITIREGHRIKVYFSQDLLLPAYTNHTILQTF